MVNADKEALPSAGPPALLGPSSSEDDKLGKEIVSVAEAIPNGADTYGHEEPVQNDAVVEYTPVIKLAAQGGCKGLQGPQIKPLHKDEPEIENEEFVEFIRVEKNRWQNCANLPLITLIWVVFILVQWIHGEVGLIFNMRQCLYRAIDETEVHVPLADLTYKNLTLSSLESSGDLWRWVGDGLVHSVSGQDSGRPGFLRTFNQVIGGIELRQTRVIQGDCQVDSGVAEHYGVQCTDHSEASVEAYGPGTEEPADMAFVAGGGLGLNDITSERFIAWLNVMDIEQGKAESTRLWNLGWIDDFTKRVDLQIAFFNAEIRAYALITIGVTFTRVGIADKDLEIHPLNADVYPKWWYAIPDIIWALLLLKLTASTMQQVADSSNKSFVGRCFPDAWAVVEHVAAVFGFCIIIFFITSSSGISSLSDKVGAFRDIDPVTNLQEYRTKNGQIITDLQDLANMRVYARIGMFWYVFVIMLLFFKSFRGQPRVAIITKTFARSASDLAHFGFLMLVVTANFALGGYVIFGSEAREWSTVYMSIHSTIAMTYGRGDFASIHSVAPWSATIWLLLYIVVLVFVMLNMIIAILSIYYGQVKSSLEDMGLSLAKQAYFILDDAIWSTAYQIRRTYRRCRRTRLGRRLPELHEEPVRVTAVPYGDILEGMHKIIHKPHKTRFTEVSQEFLESVGCDEATAARMLNKYMAFRRRKIFEAYPMGELFAEYELVMDHFYKQIAGHKEDVHQWYSDRLLDFEKLAPRQKHLKELSEQIVPDDLPMPSQAIADADDGLENDGPENEDEQEAAEDEDATEQHQDATEQHQDDA